MKNNRLTKIHHFGGLFSPYLLIFDDIGTKYFDFKSQLFMEVSDLVKNKYLQNVKKHKLCKYNNNDLKYPEANIIMRNIILEFWLTRMIYIPNGLLILYNIKFIKLNCYNIFEILYKFKVDTPQSIIYDIDINEEGRIVFTNFENELIFIDDLYPKYNNEFDKFLLEYTIGEFDEWSTIKQLNRSLNG